MDTITAIQYRFREKNILVRFTVAKHFGKDHRRSSEHSTAMYCQHGISTQTPWPKLG